MIAFVGAKWRPRVWSLDGGLWTDRELEPDDPVLVIGAPVIELETGVKVTKVLTRLGLGFVYSGCLRTDQGKLLDPSPESVDIAEALGS